MRKVSREAVIAINNAFPDQKDFDLMKELEKIESGGVEKKLTQKEEEYFYRIFQLLGLDCHGYDTCVACIASGRLPHDGNCGCKIKHQELHVRDFSGFINRHDGYKYCMRHFAGIMRHIYKEKRILQEECMFGVHG